jgi:hypothetical protein
LRTSIGDVLKSDVGTQNQYFINPFLQKQKSNQTLMLLAYLWLVGDTHDTIMKKTNH